MALQTEISPLNPDEVRPLSWRVARALAAQLNCLGVMLALAQAGRAPATPAQYPAGAGAEVTSGRSADRQYGVAIRCSEPDRRAAARRARPEPKVRVRTSYTPLLPAPSMMCRNALDAFGDQLAGRRTADVAERQHADHPLVLVDHRQAADLQGPPCAAPPWRDRRLPGSNECPPS